LAAAAAVVVLGVGIGQLDLSPSGDDSEASGSSAESADQGAGGDSSGSLREEPAEEAAPNAFSPPSDAPVITPDGFKETVDQLRDQAMVRANGASTLDADLLTTDSMFVCEPTAFGPGRLLAVRYDGSPAVLAYRPPTGTTQSVELLQCGTGAVLRSVVLPYP
ncbi:MAG: hypothetical protein JWN84_3863, partial [Nocardioides sp.]|nr:hypothetical protein [Nocardioides sp.]